MTKQKFTPAAQFHEPAHDLTEAELIADNNYRAYVKAIDAFRRYGTHTDECSIVQRQYMSPLGAKTVEDVMGPAVCNCGFNDTRKALS